MTYAEWFTRLMGNPAVVAESQAIQKRKQSTGYDPNHVTKRPGSPVPGTFRELFRKSGMPKVEKVDASDLPGLEGLMADGPERDPSKQYCSFCGIEVQKIDITTEKVSRMLSQIDIDKDEKTGDVTVTEKLRAQTQRVTACPNCCLKIKKPEMTRRV